MTSQFPIQDRAGQFQPWLAAMGLAALLWPGPQLSASESPKSATFDAKLAFNVTIPVGTRTAQAWFVLPQHIELQKVRDFSVTSPYEYKTTKDSHGNRLLFLNLKAPTAGSFELVETFTLTRQEQLGHANPAKAKPLTDKQRDRFDRFLKSGTYIIVDDRIKALAGEIAGGETNPVLVARKIYDWVLDHVDYWVKDPTHKKPSGVGSTEYCLNNGTGNCTDFHALWISLARASGIPAKMVYGSFLKADLDNQDADQSYHCWAEFFVNGIGWIPTDPAVADIYHQPIALDDTNTKLINLTTADGYRGVNHELVDFYFCNLDDRRITWSYGRDLTLQPRQAAGPVNALPKAYIEFDGKPATEGTDWTRKLTYHEIK